jgi:hypothetical protein
VRCWPLAPGSWPGRCGQQKAGLAFVVIDGTLIAIDRVAKDRPFYSGKHQKHGMNLQVISTTVRRRAGRALPAALTDSHTLGSVRGPAQPAEKHPDTDRRLSPSAHKETRSTARRSAI